MTRITRLPARTTPSFMLVIALFLLILSWFGLWWVGEVVSWSLAPYDTTPLERQPPVGTWQRDASDFFQYSVGGNGLTVILAGLSLALFLLALRKALYTPGSWVHLLIGFPLANFALAAGVSMCVFAMGNLPLELSPYPGYGWTVKFLVPEILLLGLWILLQARTIPRWIRLKS